MPDNFEQEKVRLKKAVDELAALNQIANAINALMTVEQITQVIIDHCLKRIQASQGAVFLIDEKDKEADKFRTFIREYSAAEDAIPYHINESLTGWMIKNKTIFLSNDPDNDPRFKWMHLSKAGINSILSAPLLSRNNLIGSLILFNKEDSDGFTEEDKRFLGIVGSQTAKVIENARLREQEERYAIIDEEIRLARSIQAGFLPKTGVKTEGYETCGFNAPARDVGGDFYDMIQLDENRLFISLGDVSGKGMPAALLMANAQAVLRAQLLDGREIHLSDLARSLNHLICQFTRPEQFITALFGIFDCQERKLSYINAGHEPPMLIRHNGSIERPDYADLVIGIMPDITYTINSINMEKDDFLVVYTDGVTEAFNESGEQFGEERLTESLKQCMGLEATEICRKLTETVSSFRGSASQSDDITVMIHRVCR